MVDRQYVACQFGSSLGKAFTYHNDREPVAVGDRVIVGTKRGPATVTVVGIVKDAPEFETKPIVGKERPIIMPIDLGGKVSNIVNGRCMECGKKYAECDCLPF